MKHEEWLLCPICHNKTRIKIRENTELKSFLFTVLNANRKF